MKRIFTLFSTAMVLGLFALPAPSLGDVYELRTYTTNEGKLDALHARFRDHTVALFEKHGIESVGYWVPTDEEKSQNTLIYVIRHKSRDAAKESWAAFIADPEWKTVAEESQRDGQILAKRPESVYMELTDYSPPLNGGDAEDATADDKPEKGDKEEVEDKEEDTDDEEDDDVFELRIYKAAEGKLEKLDARFRDHTMALFERHGIANVAYWHPTDEPDSADTLIYIIKHESPEAAIVSWKAFGADPDWKAAASASGVGRLAKPPVSIYMKATDYSAIK